jgi:cell division protein FtsL
VQLLPEGLDYVGELIDRKTTQKSLLSTNRSMKYLTGLLVAVGIVSICIQANQCRIYQGQLDIQRKQLQVDTLHFQK